MSSMFDDTINAYWRARADHNEELAAELMRQYDEAFDAAWAEAQATETFGGVALPEDVRKQVGIMPGTLHQYAPDTVGWQSSAGYMDGTWYPLDKRLCSIGFKDVERWSDGFRAVWTRTNEDGSGAVITYCEGDVSVRIHATAGAMQADLRDAEAFYAGSK